MPQAKQELRQGAHRRTNAELKPKDFRMTVPAPIVDDEANESTGGQWYFMTPECVTDPASPLFHDHDLLKVFLYVLRRRAIKRQAFTIDTGRRQKTVTVQTGQCIVGENSGGKDLRMAPSKFRRRLHELSELGLVELTPTEHFTLVAIDLGVKRHEEEIKPRKTREKQTPQHAENQESEAALKKHRSSIEVASKKHRSSIEDKEDPLDPLDPKDPKTQKRRGSGSRSHPLGDFVEPSLEEVQAYAKTLGDTHASDCVQGFHDHYTDSQWKRNNDTPVKDWRAAFDSWVKREFEPSPRRVLQRRLGRPPQPVSDLGIEISDPNVSTTDDCPQTVGLQRVGEFARGKLVERGMYSASGFEDELAIGKYLEIKGISREEFKNELRAELQNQ